MNLSSVFTRFMARTVLAIVSFQLAFGQQLAAAQTAPAAASAPAPADTRTTVGTSANGTPVVNVATPNGAGVSHNRFNTYDVDSRGLILNNSAVNAVSQLGGGTQANPNLSPGQAASLILNEVVAPNAGSMLAGYQEILGPSAELVIANPWGITCNGCGFLNTPRVTLTTGVPTLSGTGVLAGFTITGGQLAVGAKGLDATRQSALDLLARSVSIGGNVIVGSQTNGVAGDLQVLAGASNFDYNTRTGTAAAGSGPVPQFAIDSSVLGGMYADRIRLLVTEHGAGVRTAGNLAALADDLLISADGRIELRGGASASRDLTVSGTDVQIQLPDSNTYVYGGRDLNVAASGALDLGTGSVGSQRNTSLAAASLQDTGGANDLRFASTGVLGVNVTGSSSLGGGYWTAPQLSFSADTATFGNGSVLYGTGGAGNSLNVTTSGLMSLAGGALYSNADAALNAGRLEIDSKGVIAATGALSAMVGSGSAGGLDNSGVLQGDSVAIGVSSSSTATPTTFHNGASGSIIANNALAIGATSGTATAGALVNEGQVSGASVVIGTTDTANSGALQATSNLDLRSATLENTGKDASIVGTTNPTGSVTIAADTVTNSGTIWSAGDLTLHPTTLTQQRAAGATSNPLIGAGRDLTIAYSGNADLGAGDLQAGRDLTITGTQINDLGQTSAGGATADVRYAGRNLVAAAAPGGSVDIAGGQWVSQADLRLTGDDVILGRYFDSQLGTNVYVSGVQLFGGQGGSGVLALNARTGYVNLLLDAAAFSGSDLTITQTTPFTLFKQNVLQAKGLLSVAAGGSIDNYGTLAGGSVALLSSNGQPLDFTNWSTGVVFGSQALAIGSAAAPAGTIGIVAPASGSQAGIYGGVLDLNATTLLNAGNIQGVGAGSTINVALLSNSAGALIQGFADAAGKGGLTINTNSLSNFGLLFDSSALTINAVSFLNSASGSIASPGLLRLAAGGTGALAARNLGQIGGFDLDLSFASGLVNGLDPGNAANRTNHADIFAIDRLNIAISNGSTLANYATLESNNDLNISYLGSGAGTLSNQMSMLRDSELTWIWDGQKAVSSSGDMGFLSSANGSSSKHDVTIGGNTYYWFGNASLNTETAAYQDNTQTTTWNQTFASGVDPNSIPRPTIRGANVNVTGFENVLNNGVMEASNNMTVSSSSPTSTVNNTTLQFGQRDQYFKYVESYTCQRSTSFGAAGTSTVDWGCGQLLAPNTVQDDGPYLTYAPNTTTSAVRPGNTAFAGRMTAGNTLTVTAGNIINRGQSHVSGPAYTLPTGQTGNQVPAVSVTAPGAAGARGGATTLNVNGAQIPLPTSANGRFIPAQGASSGPLIETNPAFGIDSLALGSDYLAKLLGLNPDTQTRRLGDDNYEAYLIQQQVASLTGRSVLGNYAYASDMEAALFDNAAEEAKTLNLGYGKALTPEQVASLTSDIVWMVEQEVQGQKVLVPVVYLTQASRATAASGNTPTMQGYNVNLSGGTVTNLGGDIVATNRVKIDATGNIENLSGRIAGWNVQLNAGGDIVNSTLTRRVGDADNGTDVAGRIASIEAGNTAVLNAGRDIKVNGAWVTAGKDAALIAARNVDIQSLALTTNSQTGTADNYDKTQTQTALGAGVQAGGNAILRAGQDANLTGAEVSAGGVASIHAERNVNVGVLELTNSSTSARTKTDTYTQLDVDSKNASATLGYGIEHKTTTDTTTTTVGMGSNVSGKGVVISTGTGDVNINGSTVTSGSDGTLIDSARDVNITAYNNKTETTSTTDRVRVGVQVDASADGVYGGAAQSGTKTSTTTTQTTAQTSTLKSGGNIVIRGKGDVVNEGTQFNADGDVALMGNNVINKAARNTFSTSTTTSQWETKEQEGLTTNGTGASINNAVQGQGTQVTVGTPEIQQRITGSYSTDTQTQTESQAVGTGIKAGGNVVVIAKNNASDEGTQYQAGKDVVISAENYENKAAADTTTTTDETTHGSGQATVGVNVAAEVAITASAEGGHQTNTSTQSTARTGGIKAGGAVVIQARSGDVTLEGTQIDGAKGVGISAARDLKINQANDTSTNASSEQSGSGRVSASVSLVGAGASVGVGTSTRLANSNDSTSHAETASIKSGNGNVQLTAGRDLSSQGANIAAGGDVALKAGRNIDLAAATDKTDRTGSVDAGGADVNVGFGTGAAKGNGSVGANVNFERGRTDYHETTEHGSSIQAGGNFSLDAGGNARLQGTQVDAANASLKTGGNLTLESAQHTVKDNSYDVSGDLGLSASKGGGVSGATRAANGGTGSGSGKGGNAAGGNAQVNYAQSKQDIQTNTNATINTRGGTSVKVGGDLALKGANINAQGGVSGEVAGNLTVETRTDKVDVNQADVKAYAGIAPVGGSSGGSKAQRVQEGVQTGANSIGQSGVFTDVNTQKKNDVTINTASGITGGSGGIHVTVGGNTTLKGATNAGTDFNTQGQTTIDSVQTHTSESGTQFRVAGTAASMAGSDKGKGGDYGLSVHVPGSHGGTTEEPAVPKISTQEPEAAPPTRPRADTEYANNPHAQEPVAPPTRPRADTEYANNPHAQEPVAPPTRPRADTEYANNPHAQEPIAPPTRPRANTEYANNPGKQHPQEQPDAGALRLAQGNGEPHGNLSHPGQQEAPHDYAPVREHAPADDHAPPHDYAPVRESAPARDYALARDRAPARDVPANNDAARAPADPLENVPANYGRPVPAEGHNAQAPADANSQGAAGSVGQPIGQPPGHHPAEGPGNVPVEQQRRDLIASDERARALFNRADGLNPAERADTQTNLAEILAFTRDPRHAAQREPLLSLLEESLEGPRVRGDGLTEFPLRPQYVGENVEGFAHWKVRQPAQAPGASYEQNLSTRKVKYYTPEEQEQARLLVGSDRKLRFNDRPLSDGKWMFVVDAEGRLLARPYPTRQEFIDDPNKEFIHHSSLAAGKPVLMAGVLKVSGGRLTDIENESGHFRPDTQAFKRFLVSLREQGVDLSRASAPAYKYVATEHNLFRKTFDDPNLLAGRTLSEVDPHGMLKPMRAAGEGHVQADHDAVQHAVAHPVPELEPAGNAGHRRQQDEDSDDEDLYQTEDNYQTEAPNVPGHAPNEHPPEAPPVGVVVQPAASTWVARRPGDQTRGGANGPGANAPEANGPGANGGANGRSTNAGGNVVRLAPTRAAETSQMRLARIDERVGRVLGADEQLRALAGQAESLRGARLNADDVKATQRNLAEIVEFTRLPQNAGERAELLARFQQSLQAPHEDENGVREFPLMPQYVGEDIPGFNNWRSQGRTLPGETYNPGQQTAAHPVQYLTEQQREQARIYLHDGKFVDAQGKPIRYGRYIFVVDTEGRFIATPANTAEVMQGKIHHSSLSGGKPVRMAGEIRFDEGRLDEIQNRSGHFRPDQQSFERFLGELLSQGVRTTRKPSATVHGVEGRASGGIEARVVVDNLFKNRQALQPGPGRMLAPLALPEDRVPREHGDQPAPGAGSQVAPGGEVRPGSVQPANAQPANGQPDNGQPGNAQPDHPRDQPPGVAPPADAPDPYHTATNGWTNSPARIVLARGTRPSLCAAASGRVRLNAWVGAPALSMAA